MGMSARRYDQIADVTGKFGIEEIRERYKAGFRVVGNVDSGGHADRAALSVLMGNIHTRIKYLKGVYSWKYDDKADPPINELSMRDDIARLHEVIHFDILGYEGNNMGRTHSVYMNEMYKIKPFVYTTSRATTAEALSDPAILNKHQTIMKINTDKKQGRIILPKKKTDGILLLLREFDTYVVKINPATGNRIYEAEGTNSDDAVSSFLGGWHILDHLMGAVKARSDRFVYRGSSGSVNSRITASNYKRNLTEADIWEKIGKNEL